MMGADRQKEFERNLKLEALLAEINGLLGPVEDEILTRYQMPEYPVILVVGVPRCGSTLMLQWLASTGRFAYPSNLLSRFYGAPYLGAKIQQLLTDPNYSFRNELQGFGHEVTYRSDLGKTQGMLAPNEFWYFWRRFIPNTEPRYLVTSELEQVKGKEFAAELAAIEDVFGKPVAMKGLILELNIPFLSSLLDRALFVYVRRQPFYNVQSLLEARVRYFGDQQAWYSIKPREYKALKDLDPIEQVVGQVYYTSRAIEDGLGQIDSSRSMVVEYEEFCENPRLTFEQIMTRFRQQGVDASWDYVGPSRFRSTNQVRLSEEERRSIENAYGNLARRRRSVG